MTTRRKFIHKAAWLFIGVGAATVLGISLIPPTTKKDSCYDESYSAYVNFIQSQKKPVDYSEIMGSTRAVYFGETHSHLTPKYEMVDYMPDFANLGFTHFGMESFNVDFQSALSTYFDTGNGYEDILRDLQQSSPVGEYYIPIVESARKNRLRILALDLRRDRKNEIRGEIDKAIGESNYKREKELTDMLLKEREECMSNVVSNTLGNSEARIVTFGGGIHNDHISKIVSEKIGVHGVAAEFTGQQGLENAIRIDKAAEIINMENERFMVQITPEWREKLCSNDSFMLDDFIIHLPSNLP